MTGEDYAAQRRTEILSADPVCRSDANEYCAVRGDVSVVQDLTIALVTCQHADRIQWESNLTKLVQDTHFGLRVVPYAAEPHLIVSGTMGPDWIHNNLYEKKGDDKEFYVIALDLKPLRWRWFDLDHGSGPIDVLKTAKRREAKKHIKVPSAKKEGGGRLFFEPTGTTAMYYLFFRAEYATAPAIAKSIRENTGLPVRDLFLVEQQYRHRMQDGQLVKCFGELGDDAYPLSHFLTGTEVVAVVQMEPDVVCVPNSKERRSYQKLLEWGQQFKKDLRDNTFTVDVVPYECIHDAEEIALPYSVWLEYLTKTTKENDAALQIPIGWLESAGNLSLVGGRPPFVIQQSPMAIVGAKGSGKSIIAFHQLARYAKDRGFTVIFINYKNSGEGTVPTADEGPRQHGELLDFAAVIDQAAGVKTLAIRWQDLPRGIEPGGVYYTEFWPGRTSWEVWNEIKKVVGQKVVLCFDEVVNATKRDPGLDPEAPGLMRHLLRTERSNHIYAMIIHQSLSDLWEETQTNGIKRFIWPGFQGDSYVAMTGLIDKSDKDLYDKLFYDRKPTFHGYDVKFERLKGLVKGKFAFVPPEQSRRFAPIPLQIPDYKMLSDSEKEVLKGRVPWGQIDYQSWKKAANSLLEDKNL